MRASILLWSTASGLILGLFVDATLVGVALLLSAIVPGVSFNYRWVRVATAVLLMLIPLSAAVLGYLEGQLKTV